MYVLFTSNTLRCFHVKLHFTSYQCDILKYLIISTKVIRKSCYIGKYISHEKYAPRKQINVFCVSS
jgi:hypothetical protein